VVFALHGGLGGHGFESRVADLREKAELGGVPRGLRSPAGSRAIEVDRTVPEVYQSGKWCRFGTLLYRIRFGTVRYSSSDTLVKGGGGVAKNLCEPPFCLLLLLSHCLLLVRTPTGRGAAIPQYATPIFYISSQPAETD
jgi:hypothetical protein